MCLTIGLQYNPTLANIYLTLVVQPYRRRCISYRGGVTQLYSGRPAYILLSECNADAMLAVLSYPSSVNTTLVAGSSVIQSHPTVHAYILPWRCGGRTWRCLYLWSWIDEWVIIPVIGTLSMVVTTFWAGPSRDQVIWRPLAMRRGLKVHKHIKQLIFLTVRRQFAYPQRKGWLYNVPAFNAI